MGRPPLGKRAMSNTERQRRRRARLRQEAKAAAGPNREIAKRIASLEQLVRTCRAELAAFKRLHDMKIRRAGKMSQVTTHKPTKPK